MHDEICKEYLIYEDAIMPEKCRKLKLQEMSLIHNDQKFF